MNSMIQTLIILRESKAPLKARQIGLQCEPIRSLNTIIKNIHFLRKEFGMEIILDDDGAGSRDSRENFYEYNPDYTLRYEFFHRMTEKNRMDLTEVIKSEITERDITKKEVPMRHKKIIADSLSFDEALIVADFYHQYDSSCIYHTDDASDILNELVNYRVISDTTNIGDGNNIHFSPFYGIPGKLMKRIDKIIINQMSQEVAA